MGSCKILNKTNGKESELYKELYNVLGTEELATEAYASVMSDGFQEDFGDWVDNYEYAFFDSTMAMRQNDAGEPKLFRKKGTDQYYFEGKSERIFLNKIKFSEFTEEEVSEITNQLLYNLLSGNNLSFNHIDEDNLPNTVMIRKSIDERMNNYINSVTTSFDNGEISEDEKLELVSRANKVKEYGDEFTSEMSDKIQSYGFKTRANMAKESNEEDLDNTDGKDPNFSKDSFESNSKEAATSNTKLFLSQILAKQYDDNGDITTQDGDYLKMPKFAEFEDVWSTLEPVLSDVVSLGHGEELKDTFGLMISRIEELESSKPWTIDLVAKLQNASEFKKTEFVQAFSKTKLNFLVTEVNGKSYRVINASVVGSREYKLRNQWKNQFHDKWNDVLGTASEQAAKGLNELKDDIDKKVMSFSKEFYSLTDNPEAQEDLVLRTIDFVSAAMNRLGAKVTPDNIINHLDLNGGQDKEFDNINNTLKDLSFAIKNVLQPKGFGTNVNRANPFSDQKNLRAISKSMSLEMVNLSENTVVLNGGKMGWNYSSPSYLSNKVNQWKQDPTELKKLSSQTSNKNSRWISYLLANDQTDSSQARKDEISKERLEELGLVLAASFKSKGKADGVDNKKQTKPDAINESIFKMLSARIGGKSYMPTIVPADKSRRVELEGLPYYESKTSFKDGKLGITKQTKSIFLGYFEDEYNRMIDVWNEIDNLDDSQKIQHYHTGAMNGTKSQLFPSLSHDNKDLDPVLRAALYKEDGRPISLTISGLTAVQKKALDSHMVEVIRDRIADSYKVTKDLNNISQELLDSYGKEGVARDIALAADHAINGMISTIEYTKMFSGDPAYYKSMPDMIKRIPATYSDGQQLRLKNSDNLYFNQATISNVKVASEYLQEIIDSVDNDPKIAESYKRVNTTDAQGWITPNRWKFLQEKLGKWTPLHDKAYANMMAGKTLSKRELKLAAQPLKGVYFEINDGRPVYLKYSQAVIIPSMVKGGPMETLLNKMTKDADGKQLSPMDEIGEVVTADGVKVGAVAPTTINKEGTTDMLGDFELNPVKLTNRGWKLQQDLPTKLTKQAAVGSQIQKNILASMAIDGEYVVNGKNISGAELVQEIHDTVSTLSNMGKDFLTNEFGIVDGRITKKDRLYNALIEEFRGKDGGENIISALEKETPLDEIPQVRQQVQSMFMSIMNKEMTKIKTNGASLIQVSGFGIDKGLNIKESGIKIVSENYDPVRGLKPPRIEDGVVKPGQVFVPYSALKSLVSKVDKNLNFDSMTSEELIAIIDPSALQMITYRIPNQGMSSNDAVEIAGILPDSMGDAIIGYDAIPGKTGSDFDIDKMFVMMHNLEVRNGKIQKISSNQSSKKGVQNKLVDLYTSVLTSKNTYNDMMRSIDASFLKDDIDSLFSPEPLGDLQLFSPTKQIDVKFDYVSGKAGVGQTANMLVDHVINQTQSIKLAEHIGIGHMSPEGFTMMDEVMDTTGVNSIAVSLSAFLNAYVDIAKDPYITRGNHNAVTANITFMLLRAGVELEWVNRFIGQPILKDLVAEMEKTEGITSDVQRDKNGKKLDAYDIVRARYGAKKFKTTLMDSQATDLKSKAFLEKQIKSEMPLSQGVVLNVFEHLMGLSKSFSESVIASKADTKGGGTSFAERTVLENKKQKVIDEGLVLGFEEKFQNTMLGTYHSNAVDFVGDVLSNSSLSISANRSLHETFNNISNRMGRGELISSIDLAKDLDNSYYSYAMSGTSLFSDVNENNRLLFEKLPDFITKAKKDGIDSFIINELMVEKFGQDSFLKIDSSNKPAIYKNKIYRSWNSLYRDPATKGLAVSLVKYAFASSGFKSGLGQFFTHIPHEILKAEGISKDFKKISYQVADSGMDSNFRDQYFRNNWNNPKIVKRVSFGQANVFKNEKLNTAFTLSKKGAEDMTTGVNSLGQKTFPEFLTVHDDPKDNNGMPVVDEMGNEVTNEMLYQYIGNVQEAIKGKETTKFSPLYVRTHKLGKSTGKGNMVEWAYDTQINSSSIAGNNLNIVVKQSADKVKKEAMASADLIPSALLMDTSSSQVSEEFSKGNKIVNKADTDSYKTIVRKSGSMPSKFFTATTKYGAFYNNETGKRESMPNSVAFNLNNKNNLYDAISEESGEVFIENVDLVTGFQYIAKGNIDAIQNNIDEIANDNDITCKG